LTHKDAPHVVNQAFREANGRIDDIEKVLGNKIQGQATLNFGSIGAGACVERPAYVLGATQDGVPHSTPIVQIGANLVWSSWITDKNQVTIRVCNPTVAPIAANTLKWKVTVV
jgi:hypothetical protein